MIMNITFRGQSTDFVLEGTEPGALTDDELLKLAAQVGAESKRWPSIRYDDLSGFVVDRLPGDANEPRVYVRPKVPFGGEF